MIPTNLLTDPIFFRSRLCRGLFPVICYILFLPSISAQSETEIYLADLDQRNGQLLISSIENISNNPGYDNQPAFLNEASLLYSRTRDGQTDIALYSLTEGSTAWLSETRQGSEYSPLKIPGKPYLSAIRLDTTGLQRLYRYPLSGGEPTMLVEDLKVGYQLWYEEELLVCTVLTEDRMDLHLINIGENNNNKIRKDVGRSLLRIPDSGRFSYTQVDGDQIHLRAMDPHSREEKLITVLPEGVQDVCWISRTQILCGKGNILMIYDLDKGDSWGQLGAIVEEGQRISRMAYDPVYQKLALVVAKQD